jgi:transposase InsO family protein
VIEPGRAGDSWSLIGRGLDAWVGMQAYRVFESPVRDHPIAPRSPWQNGHAERLIGSIRRECLDHIVILGEDHLRRVLKSYAAYYNGFRTHLSLRKDAPTHRPIQRLGRLVARPILGGLHHQYCRI